MHTDLDPVPPRLVPKITIFNAFNAVITHWDGSSFTFEQFITSFESFINRNQQILSAKDAVDLLLHAVPLAYSETTSTNYRDIISEIRTRVLPSDVFQLRIELSQLEPIGLNPVVKPDLIRISLSKHHQLFFKTFLPEFYGICDLKRFLPPHVVKDIEQRLWEHKKQITYNFVRDLALNLLKNEPQQRITTNGKTAFVKSRAHFTLLPHNPPYHAFEMPKQRENEPVSCFENRKRQLIESRERKGICGYCMGVNHEYWDCKYRKEWENKYKRQRVDDDNFVELAETKRMKVG